MSSPPPSSPTLSTHESDSFKKPSKSFDYFRSLVDRLPTEQTQAFQIKSRLNKITRAYWYCLRREWIRLGQESITQANVLIDALEATLGHSTNDELILHLDHLDKTLKPIESLLSTRPYRYYTRLWKLPRFRFKEPDCIRLVLLRLPWDSFRTLCNSEVVDFKEIFKVLERFPSQSELAERETDEARDAIANKIAHRAVNV